MRIFQNAARPHLFWGKTVKSMPHELLCLKKIQFLLKTEFLWIFTEFYLWLKPNQAKRDFWRKKKKLERKKEKGRKEGWYKRKERNNWGRRKREKIEEKNLFHWEKKKFHKILKQIHLNRFEKYLRNYKSFDVLNRLYRYNKYLFLWINFFYIYRNPLK